MNFDSVTERTFFIRCGNSKGTAFAIDRNDKQYLITARHVIKGISSGHSISIFRDKQWNPISLKVVGLGLGAVDVAVLAVRKRLATSYHLEASSHNLAYGQQVYFLGFPFGWDGGAEYINQGFPLPFIKSGIVSAIVSDNNSCSRIDIDAHGNKGFSGAPVVFAPYDQPQGELNVAGVVANYPTPLREPIVDKDGNPIMNNRNEPVAYFPENPGFVRAPMISHATDLIDANP